MSKYAAINTLDHRLYMLGFMDLGGMWKHQGKGLYLSKIVVREYRTTTGTGADGKPHVMVKYGEPKLQITTWEIRGRNEWGGTVLLYTATSKRSAVNQLEKMMKGQTA